VIPCATPGRATTWWRLDDHRTTKGARRAPATLGVVADVRCRACDDRPPTPAGRSTEMVDLRVRRRQPGGIVGVELQVRRPLPTDDRGTIGRLSPAGWRYTHPLGTAINRPSNSALAETIPSTTLMDSMAQTGRQRIRVGCQTECCWQRHSYPAMNLPSGAARLDLARRH
jgi:hypothetical protein